MSVQPFEIAIPEQKLAWISDRVSQFNWDDFPDLGGWSGGMARCEMRRIAGYWINGFDWRKQETHLNSWPQFLAEVEGQSIHFFSIQGSAPGQRPPVLLIHGWPGSCVEFIAAAERLAHPERYGGRVEDSLDLIIPSLPGYGFSGRPARPISPRRISGLLNTLMTDILGHRQYVAQGGDWGSVISAWMAHDYPDECVGLHLNMALLKTRDAKPRNEEDAAYLAHTQRMQVLEGGYSHQQGTRPQTLGYALADSPVGAAAWILEKFAAWSDLPRDQDAAMLEPTYSLDKLLTNIMFYVGTGNLVTSCWLYKASYDERGLPLEHRISVPTAVAAFPDPIFPPPPKGYAEQSYNIQCWTPMERGGHFAAMEQPAAFAENLRHFVLSLNY